MEALDALLGILILGGGFLIVALIIAIRDHIRQMESLKIALAVVVTIIVTVAAPMLSSIISKRERKDDETQQ
jgi:membrane protein implicated in regulation of membrane protease activity